MSKRVIISVKRKDGAITTDRAIIDDDLMPATEREWDILFEELEATFQDITKVSHPMDLATDDRPLGPYFERFP